MCQGSGRGWLPIAKQILLQIWTAAKVSEEELSQGRWRPTSSSVFVCHGSGRGCSLTRAVLLPITFSVPCWSKCTLWTFNWRTPSIMRFTSSSAMSRLTGMFLTCSNGGISIFAVTGMFLLALPMDSLIKMATTVKLWHLALTKKRVTCQEDLLEHSLLVPSAFLIDKPHTFWVKAKACMLNCAVWKSLQLLRHLWVEDWLASPNSPCKEEQPYFAWRTIRSPLRIAWFFEKA